MNTKEYKYSCEKCFFFTNEKSHYNKHLQTKKHNSQDQIEYKFECLICHKKYKTQTGLWKHKKLCKAKQDEIKKNNTVAILITKINNQSEEIELLRTNQSEELNELKNMIIELMKREPVNQTINNNTNNFNINVFLNEKCNDSINLNVFLLAYIKVAFGDLFKIGEYGYVKGVSDLIIKNLKELTLYKRPFHYHIDEKAGSKELYIRDDNIWKQDEEETKYIIDRDFTNFTSNLLNKVKKYENQTHGVYPEIKEELLKNGGINSDNENIRTEIVNKIIPDIIIP